MMYLIREDHLRQYLNTGILFKYNDIMYKVGQMSYGDYFLEPYNRSKETDGFYSSTLWFERSKIPTLLRLIE